MVPSKTSVKWWYQLAYWLLCRLYLKKKDSNGEVFWHKGYGMFFEDRIWNINLLVVSSSWNLDLPVSFKLVVKLLAPGGQFGTVNISSRLLAASWSLLLVVFLLIGNDLYNSGFLFFMFANALTAWYPTPSQFKHPSHPPDPSSYLDLIKNLEIKSTLKYKRFKQIAWT